MILCTVKKGKGMLRKKMLLGVVVRQKKAGRTFEQATELCPGRHDPLHREEGEARAEEENALRGRSPSEEGVAATRGCVRTFRGQRRRNCERQGRDEGLGDSGASREGVRRDVAQDCVMRPSNLLRRQATGRILPSLSPFLSSVSAIDIVAAFFSSLWWSSSSPSSLVSLSSSSPSAPLLSF